MVRRFLGDDLAFLLTRQGTIFGEGQGPTGHIGHEVRFSKAPQQSIRSTE